MNPFLVNPIFDFEKHKAQRDEILPLIKAFAAHHAYRSAVVEELELDEDFYRRPLRPEDLDFLKFQKAISADTVSRLPALATNRLLLSAYESEIARVPTKSGVDEFVRFEQFYDQGNQVLGQRIRPYLEAYGFSYLANERIGADAPVELAGALEQLIRDERKHWDEVFSMLIRNDYLEEGLRFILIQRWSLAASRSTALTRAAAAGYFGSVASQDWPALNGLSMNDNLLGKVAAASGVSQRAHSYWQFYLPTSLAKVNLLYALGSVPDRAFALLGAAFAAEAEAEAFQQSLLHACPHLSHLTSGDSSAVVGLARSLSERFANAAKTVESHYGAPGLARLSQGLGAAVKLCGRARWDIGEQLRWLSSIERYCAWAKRISVRIEAECPGIDRETFVEPREMCSTTHVHNDHRLVVIESGDMIFWGNLGMRLGMTVGDMVLIPDGRLHGSTVVSEECTYHQPIIPNEWISELLAETAIQPAQAAMRA